MCLCLSSPPPLVLSAVWNQTGVQGASLVSGTQIFDSWGQHEDEDSGKWSDVQKELLWTSCQRLAFLENRPANLFSVSTHGFLRLWDLHMCFHCLERSYYTSEFKWQRNDSLCVNFLRRRGGNQKCFPCLGKTKKKYQVIFIFLLLTKIY